MKSIEVLVEKLYAENGILQGQQRNIDEIFEMIRAKDMNSNPLSAMMGRNYRFFANIKHSLRGKLQR